jgi:seryl-tRNA synthetase
MFDLKLIRETPDVFDAGWKRRGLPPQTPKIIEMDEKRRKLLTESQELQAKRNDASKQIGAIKSKGGDAAALMQEVAGYKDRIAALEEQEKIFAGELNDFLSSLPNIPDATVPNGTSEKDNVEVCRSGDPKRTNSAKDHVAIGEALGGMDFETAAKMSGSRFVVLRSGVARLERALAQFMLDTHAQEHGYTEMSVPLLVGRDALYGTGQLPKFENDLFRIDNRIHNIPKLTDVIVSDETQRLSSKYLIPTSEVSLTNTVMDSIVDIADLPLRLTSLTPCFRSEAGAAGKDTRGIIRQHQFYKVEMVSITAADKSDEEHKRMTECAENILKKLDLAFRTITLCTGDMGFSARKTYDIEVWLPGQNAYREISSCSNCGDFQARRMKSRYKVAGDKNTTYVHTLNGSGLAVGRALVAVLENYQQPDGSVVIPDVLKPYMGGVTKLEPVVKKGKVANA